LIRIIHLSDFHLQRERLQAPQEYLINALLRDMEQYINNETLIVFSGDFVDKGGLKFEDPDLKFYYFEEYLIDPIL